MYYTSGNIALTGDQKKLVRESWALIKPIQETAAHLFYYHLFRQNPELKHLFSGNMKVQGEKLMAAIGVVVTRLDELDRLTAHLKMAGKAHRKFGVTLADYKKLQTSLLWTLEACLGDRYTKDIRDAWAETYNLLSFPMIEGAEYGTSKSGDPLRNPQWFDDFIDTI